MFSCTLCADDQCGERSGPNHGTADSLDQRKHGLSNGRDQQPQGGPVRVTWHASHLAAKLRPICSSSEVEYLRPHPLGAAGYVIGVFAHRPGLGSRAYLATSAPLLLSSRTDASGRRIVDLDLQAGRVLTVGGQDAPLAIHHRLGVHRPLPHGKPRLQRQLGLVEEIMAQPRNEETTHALHLWARSLVLNRGTDHRMKGSYTRHEGFASQVLTCGHAIRPCSQEDPPHARIVGGTLTGPRSFRNQLRFEWSGQWQRCDGACRRDAENWPASVRIGQSCQSR